MGVLRVALTALLRLAVARLRNRKAAAAVIVAGVLLAGAVAIGVPSVSLLARDASLQDAIEDAPAAARTFRVAVARVAEDPVRVRAGTSEHATGLDPLVAGALPREGYRRQVRRGAIFGEAETARDGRIALAALDDPQPWLRLRSGRLPRACTPRACEAVALGAARVASRLAIGDLRLTIVGRGELATGPLGAVPPARGTLGSGSRFLLVRGVGSLAAAPSLADTPRRYVWAQELDARAIHPWNARRIAAEARQAQSRLTADESSAQIAAPDRLVDAAHGRGRAFARHLGLVAGLGASVLLAFAAFAASLRRSDLQAELSRLRDAGARGWHLGALVVIESTVLAAAGVLAGWAVATAATAALGGDLGRTVLSGRAAGLGLSLFALATVVLSLAGGVARARLPRAALELVVLAAGGLLVWQASSRGVLDARALAAADADPVLLVLPTLVLLGIALLCGRAIPAALRLAERPARRAGPGAELAVLSLSRYPTRTAAAAGFMVMGVAASLFALSYERGLADGRRAEAAFAAGADVRVISPAAPRVARETGAGEVIRLRGETAAGAGVEVLGVPGRGTLAMAGDPLPPDATRLRFDVRLIGAPASVSAAFELGSGGFARVPVLSESPPGRHRVQRRVPERLRGGRLVALEITPPLGARTESGRAAVVVQPVSALRAGGRRAVVSDLVDGWETVGESALTRVDGAARLSYSTLGRTVVGLRKTQPALVAAVPALVTRAVAAEADEDGLVAVRVAGGHSLTVRVAGRTGAFPTLRGPRAVVTDAGGLYLALNHQFAGAAVAGEAWMTAGRGGERAAVRRARQAAGPGARIISRGAELAALAGDPLARAMSWTLHGSAVAGLLLALLGAVLFGVVLVGDERGELAELEALGVGPAALRRQVRRAALTIAAAAAVFGIAGGALLVGLVGALVEVTAAGRDPFPPLRASLDVPAAALAVAAAGIVVVVAVATITRRAFTDPAPGRLHG